VNFRVKISYILRVLFKYSAKQNEYSIKNSLNLDDLTVEKILKKIKNLFPQPNFNDNKLGGPGLHVEIDETMLNFKCKSHRGRSPHNRTDALVIAEVLNNKVSRVFATIISDKSQSTLVPIICSQVAANSIIWTDEHRSYNNLRNFSFIHDTVCHKYNFISSVGTNTQAVESINNCIKYEIKNRKGILTDKRSDFLKEFCFTFNNRTNLFEKILFLIKI
ncbi:hypothetical protein H311_01641, partial [Anncaliia algerae PRA109]